jgi:hypothetical protein
MIVSKTKYKGVFYDEKKNTYYVNTTFKPINAQAKKLHLEQVAKAKELAQRFMEKHKATCCRVLTRGMEFSGPNRKAHCTNMVDDCQRLVEELIKVEVV